MDSTRELYSRLLLAMGCTVALGCSSDEQSGLSDGGHGGSGAAQSAGGTVHSTGGASNAGVVGNGGSGAAQSAGGASSGGRNGTGASVGSGGRNGTGASVGSGGRNGTGASAGSGGRNGTGGSAGSGGNGGAHASGGAAAGGAPVDAGPDAAGGTGGSSHGGTGGFPSIRRPFLVGASMRASLVADRDDWSMEIPQLEIGDPHTANVLAAEWLKDALEEHASIAAFARFTMLLLSVGAPPDLVVASQRASVDEVAHARACFALARRYGAHDVGPAELTVADSLGALSLEDITALTVAEGCVGETLGAILAAEQLRGASDPDVSRILRRIAKDEARHAELAWRFLAWALCTGGERIATAAHEAFRATVDDVLRMRVVDYGVDLALWRAHGRVTCAEARKLSRDGVERVIWPCWHALLAEPRERARDRSSHRGVSERP